MNDIVLIFLLYEQKKAVIFIYISLGSDVAVYKDEIIGIFDIEKVSVVRSVNDYLSGCQKSGKIYYVSLDMPKSFVVCDGCVYVTNVGTATIGKRGRKRHNRGLGG